MSVIFILSILALIISLLLIMFSLAVLVDSFVIPTLEKISFKYHLPKQAEGILLAMGACIPEFTMNLTASLSDNISIGIGSICGSGAYDFTLCFGIIPFITGKPVLDKGLFYRDSVIYLVTLCLLVYFIKDNTISLIEIIILTSLWPVYLIVITFFWNKTKTRTRKKEKILAIDNKRKFNYKEKAKIYQPLEVVTEDPEHENFDLLDCSNYNKEPNQNNNVEMIYFHSDSENIKSLKEPLLLVEENPSINIPMNNNAYNRQSKCRNKKNKKCYSNLVDSKLSTFSSTISYIYSLLIPVFNGLPIINFLIQIIFLFIHTALIIKIVTIISDELKISKSFLGVTLMAIDGNICDTINAVVATKNNEFFLITTSVLGGQITNLQICLGLPWLIYLLKEKFLGKKENFIELASDNQIINNPILYFGPLITCVLACMLILTIFNMKLNKLSGACLIGVYLIYLSYESYVQTK